MLLLVLAFSVISRFQETKQADVNPLNLYKYG